MTKLEQVLEAIMAEIDAQSEDVYLGELDEYGCATVDGRINFTKVGLAVCAILNEASE